MFTQACIYVGYKANKAMLLKKLKDDSPNMRFVIAVCSLTFVALQQWWAKKPSFEGFLLQNSGHPSADLLQSSPDFLSAGWGWQDTLNCLWPSAAEMCCEQVFSSALYFCKRMHMSQAAKIHWGGGICASPQT